MTTTVKPRTSSNGRTTKKRHRRIDRLFLKMAAIYGHLWKGLYREPPFIHFAKDEWASALRAFSDEVVFQAVTLSLQRFEMPPTLPQFVQLCYQATPAVLKTIPEEDEASERSLAVAEKHLNAISRLLEKKQQPSSVVDQETPQ